jgi:hypothetical protein
MATTKTKCDEIVEVIESTYPRMSCGAPLRGALGGTGRRRDLQLHLPVRWEW